MSHGPGRGRIYGGRPPRVKQGGGGGKSGGGGKKSWLPGCPLSIAVPALTLLAACTVLTLHGP